MVHFPGFARTRLYIQRAVTWFYQIGFPHSEIPGSKLACSSPGLIAACHVLHRLLAPRHPPYALSSLTIKLTQRLSVSLRHSSHHAAKNPRMRVDKFAFPHCATLSKTCGFPTTNLYNDLSSGCLLPSVVKELFPISCSRDLRSRRSAVPIWSRHCVYQ